MILRRNAGFCATGGVLHGMVDACIDALLAFAADDFAEATHTMVFPHAEGFRGDLEVHTGTVFARALIAEALACVLDRAPRSAPVVERTLSQLLLLSRNDGSGWAYFPRLPELPSDADDLAAIVRAVTRARGRSDATACTHEALFRWLAAVPADGRASTWIASRDDDRRMLQQHWIEQAWGDTYDAEVAAHMVLALHDLGATGAVMTALCDAIASAQRDGLWESAWYWGPVYGTMMGACALATLPGYEPYLARSRDALTALQRADGGWGLDERESDQLTTAFALLALAAIASRGADARCDDAARAGIAALTRLRRDRSATPTPFIRMDLGRAAPGVTRTLSYASAAVTAAYTLKAAIAWEHLTTFG